MSDSNKTCHDFPSRRLQKLSGQMGEWRCNGPFMPKGFPFDAFRA
jgi:hypothetical protein